MNGINRRYRSAGQPLIRKLENADLKSFVSIANWKQPNLRDAPRKVGTEGAVEAEAITHPLESKRILRISQYEIAD